MEVAGTAVSGFSFLALAAEVEGAGVPPVGNNAEDFSVFSLDLDSLALSVSRSLGGSAREPGWVVREFDVDVVVVLEWATEVLA